MSNVSISEEDLKRLLQENSHMREQVKELQGRGTELVLENRELKIEAEKLRDAIRYHRDQKGDDRCWVDDLRLYEILPEGPVGYDSTLPTEEVFLENCKRFCRSRQVPVGQPFKKDW
jgi:hypothetical protein